MMAAEQPNIDPFANVLRDRDVSQQIENCKTQVAICETLLARGKHFDGSPMSPQFRNSIARRVVELDGTAARILGAMP